MYSFLLCPGRMGAIGNIIFLPVSPYMSSFRWMLNNTRIVEWQTQFILFQQQNPGVNTQRSKHLPLSDQSHLWIQLLKFERPRAGSMRAMAASPWVRLVAPVGDPIDSSTLPRTLSVNNMFLTRQIEALGRCGSRPPSKKALHVVASTETAMEWVLMGQTLGAIVYHSGQREIFRGSSIQQGYGVAVKRSHRWHYERHPDKGVVLVDSKRRISPGVDRQTYQQLSVKGNPEIRILSPQRIARSAAMGLDESSYSCCPQSRIMGQMPMYREVSRMQVDSVKPLSSTSKT